MKMKSLFYTFVSAIFSSAVVLDLMVSVINFIEHMYLDFICGVSIATLATVAAGYFAGRASKEFKKINPRVA